MLRSKYDWIFELLVQPFLNGIIHLVRTQNFAKN